MKKLFTFITLLTLLFIIVGCGSGEDPNVAAYREKLCASDWKLPLMGDTGIVFGFNEDGTGEVTLPGVSGEVIKTTYEITDATDGGDSATLTIKPDSEDSVDKSETMPETVYKTQFVPGGLQVDSGKAKTIMTPVEKN